MSLFKRLPGLLLAIGALLTACGGGSSPSAGALDSGNDQLFGESGKVYSWDAATRSSTLRIDAAPSQVMVGGTSVYFVMGAT